MIDISHRSWATVFSFRESAPLLESWRSNGRGIDWMDRGMGKVERELCSHKKRPKVKSMFRLGADDRTGGRGRVRERGRGRKGRMHAARLPPLLRTLI